MNKQRILAILAAFGAAFFYGINHTIAKDVMPMHVAPFGFIMVRLLGAAILFWITSLWGTKEKIHKSDWPRMVACALFGMCINMLCFFKGLSLSTPINSAVMVTITPIIVFILSAFMIKERITWIRIVGILLGFAGALGLVLFGAHTLQENAPNIPLGNILFIINAISFGVYLIIIKPLTVKYHPLTIMKWLVLIGIIINFPFTFSEFNEISWSNLPFNAIWRIAFVVIGATFLTYLFNIYALRHLKASTLGAFVYLQPLLGILFAVIVGADTFSLVKIIASLLVFIGVYLVTKIKKSSL